MNKIDQICEKEKIHSFEGELGVRNLAIIANRLGYKDPMYFGQFEGASYGDLILMLEDNPGAIEAVLDFLRDNYEDVDNDIEE